MDSIDCLRPNVSRDQAIRWLRSGGWTGFLPRLRHGALRSVADVYVPFRLYQVEISNRRALGTSWFALESVSGLLDLYQFDRVPEESELVKVDTRNHLPPALDASRALYLLHDKLRRIVFRLGFFRMRDLEIHAVPLPLTVHVPYWVGFYGNGSGVRRLRVIDAVRRRVEGAKVGSLLHAWLTRAQ